MSTSGATTLDFFERTYKVAKKRYLVIDEKDNVEFVIKFKTNKKGYNRYRLYHSDNRIWSEHIRNKLILTLTEKGDDFHIKFEDIKDMSKLDASDIHYLRLLTNFEASLCSSYSTLPKIIEDK